MKIILASNSKRRQELLKMLNLSYEIVVSEKEEIQDENLTPLENCFNISLANTNTSIALIIPQINALIICHIFSQSFLVSVR